MTYVVEVVRAALAAEPALDARRVHVVGLANGGAQRDSSAASAVDLLCGRSRVGTAAAPAAQARLRGGQLREQRSFTERLLLLDAPLILDAHGV